MLQSILQKVKQEKQEKQNPFPATKKNYDTTQNIQTAIQPYLENNQYSKKIDISKHQINPDEIQSKKWDYLPKAQRRLQKWGGDVTKNGLVNIELLPQFLNIICEKLYFQSQISPVKLNHVLLNEYPACVGIMPHTDGPLYYPFVNSISLLSDCLFKFYKNFESYQKKEHVIQILCEKGCLCCFTDEIYSNYLHNIEDIAIEYIFLYLEEVEGWEEGQKSIIVKECDTQNFQNTKKYKNLVSLKGGIQEALFKQYIYQVQNSQKYNYAIEIKREKRISLTIRYVEPQQQKNIDAEKCIQL